MAADRCPACGGLVRAGEGWCTLCYADLRPKPAPVPAPVAAPVAVPVPVLVVAHGVPAVVPAADPLTAPLPAVLGVEPEPAAPVVSWPCVDCGAANPLDADTCGTCMAPFGGRSAYASVDHAGLRRRRLLLGLAVAGGFLVLLAAVTTLTNHVGDKSISPATSVTGPPAAP